MGKTIEWFTKKKILAISLVMVLIYIISYFNENLGLPSAYDNFCCADDLIFNLFVIFIPIFVFSLIYFKFNEEKFQKWMNFTIIYLIIYLILYFISPTQGDGFIWLQRETVSSFGSGLYSIISFCFVFLL